MKLISSVNAAPFSSSFEGRILQPGARIAVEELGANPVLIECAGAVGKGRNREHLWILWRYDWKAGEWREVARAQASDASWTYALRDPARTALYPSSELFDVKAKAAELAMSIMMQIDKAITTEPGPVQCEVLDRIYNHLAGRIAQLLG